jgi:hypothetical protein
MSGRTVNKPLKKLLFVWKNEAFWLTWSGEGSIP